MNSKKPPASLYATSIAQSVKLDNVCYDIRGPVLEQAARLEEEGQQILKLNIGNPAPFGFNAPDEILYDVIHNLADAQGYSDSRVSTGSKGSHAGMSATGHCECGNR